MPYSDQWCDYLQMTEGIVQVSETKFICADCGTDPMTENMCVAHVITNHYEPNHRQWYSNIRKCSDSLKTAKCKDDWNEDLNWRELLRVGDLKDPDETNQWRNTRTDILSELVDRKLLQRSKEIPTKLALMETWTRARHEPDNKRVSLIHKELFNRRRTVVFFPGFQNNIHSETCQKMGRLFEGHDDNVSFSFIFTV